MKRFIEGADRTQVSLLPDCVDDCVIEYNPVIIPERELEPHVAAGFIVKREHLEPPPTHLL